MTKTSYEQLLRAITQYRDTCLEHAAKGGTILPMPSTLNEDGALVFNGLNAELQQIIWEQAVKHARATKEGH